MQHAAVAILPRPVVAASLPRPMAASAAPLAGLAGTSLARRFRHWRGASGRRHLFSVFPVDGSCDDAPRFAGAVVLAVGHDGSGERRILAMEETGPIPELVYDGARFRAALAAGADEFHVHLLTDSAEGRAALLRDLDDA